jgi:hypothetical protein
MNPYAKPYLVSDIQIHADWIERDEYLNQFVGFTNTQLTKYKKWQVRNPKHTFKVWFTTLEGDTMPVHTRAEIEKEIRKVADMDFNEREVRKMRLYQKNEGIPDVNDPTDAMLKSGMEAAAVQVPVITDMVAGEYSPPDSPETYISAFVLELLLIY